MDEQFSAAYYKSFSPDDLSKEAKKLGVKVEGLSRNQQINAVYNAELRRRQEEYNQQIAEQEMAARKAKRAGATPAKAIPVETNEGAQVTPVERELAQTTPPPVVATSIKPVDYESMKVDQLRELAKERSVPIEDRALKADIISALQASDKAQG